MSILKKAIFWTVLFSVFICFLSLIGQDDKGILMFGLDPILYHAIYNEPFRSWMLVQEFSMELTWYAYVFKICTGIIYGSIVDLIILIIKDLNNKQDKE